MVSSCAASDRQQHITALKERLLNYKLKNELLIQQEVEREAQIVQKEQLEETEKARLEQERQTLLEELQRMSAPANTSAPQQQSVSGQPAPQIVALPLAAATPVSLQQTQTQASPSHTLSQSQPLSQQPQQPQ
ncbi:hypothetical protein A0J61_03451, partial [Choanephora cucurbitarum]